MITGAGTPVSPRQRDSVRIGVARLGVERAIEKCEDLERCELDRLETDVATEDIRIDLCIARLALESARDALAHLEAAPLEQAGARR